MDTLSVELHAQIFEFACLDDGSTAQSLALVSHYVRAVARPFLYQSLSVQSLAEIHALTTRLGPLPHYLRRIRHLYLGDRDKSSTAHHIRVSGDDAELARYEETQEAAARLLLLAAPTVEKLALVADYPFTATALIAHLFALPLPRLRELAVCGYYPFPAGGAAVAGPGMPRLERLYLEGNRNPHGLLGSGGLRDSCPALAHLVIAGVVAAQGFATEVEALVCGASEHAGAGDGHEDSPLPRALRRIVIRKGSLPSNAGPVVRLYHRKMADLLERAAGDSRGRVVVQQPSPEPEAPDDKTRTLAERMRELWRERVGGGPGRGSESWWDDRSEE